MWDHTGHLALQNGDLLRLDYEAGRYVARHYRPDMSIQFGFEIAKLELDFGDEDDGPREISVVEKGTKAVSRWWVRRMVK